jgi:hypothetical protein
VYEAIQGRGPELATLLVHVADEAVQFVERGQKGIHARVPDDE